MVKNAQTTILLIEDSPSDVRLIQELLRTTSRDRFTVITASTLSKALHHLSRDSIDVVLLDLGLPDSQGLATFRAIYEQASRLPIIVLTVSDDEALGQQAVREGAQDFLSKDLLTYDRPTGGVFTRTLRYALERKRTEHELERIARFPQENPNPVMRIARRGHILYANEASDVLLREWGVQRGERVPPDWRTRIADASTRGEASTLEMTVAKRMFLSSIIPVAGEEYVNVYSIDITKRVYAEEALKTSEEQLQTLFESSPIIQLRYDPEGYPVVANRAAREFLGIDDVSAIQHIGIFSSPRISDADKARLRAGKPARYEQTYDFDAIKRQAAFPTTQSGVRHVDFSIAPIFDKDGALEAYLGQVVDITERKRAEEALQQAHEELEQRVQERTEELRHETEQRTCAEEAARAHAQHAETLSSIISAGNQAASLQSALVAMIDTAIELLGLDTGGIFLRDGDTMILQYERGYTPEQRAWSERIPITQRRIARIMAGKPWISDDYQVDVPPEVREMNKNVTSMATIPLVAGGAVVGYYNLASRKHMHHFTEDEQRLLVSIGEEAGAVIARMQAEEDARQHAHRADALSRIILRGNQTSDLQGAVTAMLDGAVDLLGFDGGLLYLRNDIDHVAELHAWRHASDELITQARRVPLTLPNLVPVYRGEAWFSEAYGDKGSSEYREVMNGVQATAVIPLIAGDEVIGHYGVWSTRPHQFAREERTLFETIGREAGSVIGRLRAEEAALQRATMLDSAHDAIITWDVDDHITYWNHGAEQLYGWPRDEAIGKHIHTLLTSTLPEPLERIKSTLTETGRWEGELVHITRTGTTVIVRSHMTLQRAPDGTPTATLEINNDITEQKQAEEQVRAASLYARSLIEASLDPLVTISAEGIITDVNTATEEVTGRSREELIGSDFCNYFTEPEKARAGYKQVFTDAFVRDYPLAIRHKSGRVTDVLYNATVYRDEAGEVQGVFAAARDVTDRKRAEEELQRYSDHLEAIVEE
ncbi:MAG: PAS domain S-box protein, partial [Euryarchaeota archaeon]|nr:PAS domain S-box protein [Euryarchaeota archaeon]